MRNKWSDFLFTLTVRFVSGAASGVILGFLICTPISRSVSQYYPLLVWVFGDQAHPYHWIGVWTLGGAIIAVLTTPWSRMPWHQEDPEEPSVWTDFGTAGDGWDRPGKTIVSKSVEISVSKDGEQHKYSSMEEVPPEIRSAIEALEKEAAGQKAGELTVTERSQTGNTSTSKIIHRTSASVYKMIDESGVERVYHSLEELPPEVRAAIAEAENKLKRG